ncbi:GILT-like protein 1 [Folsomia candida]|uniref:Gamma-interferon-inducible lysosomal thiol reductase n=1 Tax=Folsomia candida TaxID=158441 RepID=A0A226ELC1_FOLCA|nr:GILT-like protein 1 [Folsomia candida]OXA57376.1 Gamma-interferon-inducible lysosomal thiol reductase [Folsomia candida]
MKVVLGLLILGLVGVSFQAQLRLTVYYESLCPDSRRFIINQLYPTINLLGGVNNEFLEAEFVPYGKANTTFVNGTFEFVCQHGRNECLGNMIHGCALAKLAKNESAAYINCMMDSFNAPIDAEACAISLGLNYTRIGECYNNWEGPTILASAGIRTHDLVPTLYYVPWIVYNDVWRVEDMIGSEQNLMNVICQKLENSTRPTQCDQ